MFRPLATLFVVAASAACGDGTLGLAGSYEGTFDQEIRRRVTSYGFGDSTTRDEEQRLLQDGSVIVERATDFDAVLSGLACPLLPLVVDRGELVLAEETSCQAAVEADTTFGGDTTRSEDERTVTFTDVVVAQGGDVGTVEVTATARVTSEERDDGDLTSEIDENVQLSFDGFRVAWE